MLWLIGSCKEIVVDLEQMDFRRNYIERITGVEVSPWKHIFVDEQAKKGYYFCISNDELDGAFITAHIQDVYELCSLKEIYSKKFVIANTCIWNKASHKNLLFNMMGVNSNVELWFAKQELSVDSSRLFRQSNTLSNVGQFGFQTSLSERELFRNRKKGLMEAIKLSFDKVYPIILSGDY